MLFLPQESWLVNLWNESMWLHTRMHLFSVLVWLVERAAPGLPHASHVALSGQPPLAVPVQSLNLITAGYFLFLQYNATVNGSVLPQAQRTWAGCLSLRVKGEYCLPFHWGSAFWKSLFLCFGDDLCVFRGQMLDTSTVG